MGEVAEVGVGEGEPITLREHLEALAAQRWQAHEQEHRAMELAISKADEAMTVRLEAMNQFRFQLDRERGSYVTLDRMDDKIGPLVGRLDALERAQSNLAGRMAAAGIGLTVLMFAIGVALRFIH